MVRGTRYVPSPRTPRRRARRPRGIPIDTRVHDFVIRGSGHIRADVIPKKCAAIDSRVKRSKSKAHATVSSYVTSKSSTTLDLARNDEVY